MTTTPAGLAIEATGLRKSYGDQVVLNGIDLAVPEGTIFSLLGPNGAGKTTVVQILSTLINADGGEMRVAGHDLATAPDAVRAAIGVTGQFSAVDNLLTGTENLLLMADLHHLGRAAGRRRAADLLGQFDLADAAGKLAGTYSGGMRRRLDLAMTLVGNPRLIFLDEPTTGLDPASRAEVWDAVRRLVAGGTDVLLTTHYLDEADELADHVVVIDHGRAIASGTLPELKASVGRDVIEVAVADPALLGAAERILAHRAGSTPALDAGGRHARARTADGAADLGRVIRDLAEAGIAVEEIGLRRPTLDEVFLALTGEAAAPPTATGPESAGHETTEPNATACYREGIPR